MATITTTTTTMAAAETCGTIPEDGDGQPRRAQTGTGTATRATATATATAPEPAPETMMIALYYCYTALPHQSDDGSDGGAVRRHASFQTDLCESLNLLGRIRVSPEGINGVLSGRRCDLEAYEDALRRELSPPAPARCRRRFQPGIEQGEEDDEKKDGDGHGGGGDGDGEGDAADGTESVDAPTSNGGGAHHRGSSSDHRLDLDVKYCHLRPDLDAESQLFDSLSVKETAEVVSLHEPGPRRPTAGKGKKKNWRRRRRNRDRGEQRRQQQPVEEEEEGGDGERPDRHGPRDDEGCCRRSGESDDPDEPPRRRREDEGGDNEKETKREFAPATHLTPEEWHASLLRASASASSSSPGGAKSGNNGGGGGAVLLDARNVYESRVGHFAVPGVPTVLTNTRKYSNLPGALGASAREFEGRDVYMYCTGGVRCERASVYLREMMEDLKGEEGGGEGMEGPRAVYQLRGGIQRYLEVYGRLEGEGMAPPEDGAGARVEGGKGVCEEERSMPSRPRSGPLQKSADEGRVCKDGAAVETPADDPQPPMEEIARGGRNDNENGKGIDDGFPSSPTCLYRGKNFVFDPRRTDPVVGAEPSPSIVGRCLVCQAPHDDYDNGHAPAENREARCCRCRVLVLVCDDCRRGVRCWGEEEGDVDAGTATEGFDDVERADANSSARRGGNGGGGDATVVDINGGRTKASRRRPDLFCGPGGAECIDEGNAVNVEVICEENA